MDGSCSQHGDRRDIEEEDKAREGQSRSGCVDAAMQMNGAGADADNE